MRFGAIAVAVLTISLSAFAADPFVGTWKPDVEKWKLSPDAPERRKSELVVLESVGKDKYRITWTKLDGNAADTPPAIWTIDGKEHNEHEPGNGVIVRFQRVGDRHLKETAVGPKGSSVFEWIVSPDGNALTYTRKGTGTTSGRPLDEVLVYSRN